MSVLLTTFFLFVVAGFRMGDDCSPFEKAKAAKVAHNIRLKRGKAEHGSITDGTFWSYLGGESEISDESNHDPVQPLVRVHVLCVCVCVLSCTPILLYFLVLGCLCFFSFSLLLSSFFFFFCVLGSLPLGILVFFSFFGFIFL